MLGRLRKTQNGRQQSLIPKLQLEPLELRDTPAIFTVTTSADTLFAWETSLRQAITFAEGNPGPDIIQFGAGAFDANGNCTINLESPLLKITQPLQILGAVPGKSRPVIRPAPNVNGGAPFRIFDVAIPLAAKGAPVHFNNLQITGGQTPVADGNGGGIKSVNADLKVADCRVLGNHATENGGGIWATGDQCQLWILGETSAVSGNRADGDGGGIAVKNIYTLIEDGVQVSENVAAVNGGGIAVLANHFVPRGGLAGNKIFEINGVGNTVAVSANTAQNGDGGGIWVKHIVGLAPDVELDTATISQNKAYGTPPPVAGDPWTSGRGGGVAVFGAPVVNGNAATTVSGNWQSAPVTAPAVLGVHLDLGVGGTFAGTATIFGNHQFGGGLPPP
jgi:hypothetical protein